jgi:uncharacterized phage protein (TIGR01671 family)
MNRTIKYRAYRESTKSWIYGINLKDWHKHLQSNEFHMSTFWSLVDKEALIHVGEFINRHDKDNEEIYEDSIIEYCYNTEPNGNKFKGLVIYDNRVLEIGWEHDQVLFNGFILKCFENDGSDYYVPIPDIPDIKVIGNKWQSPELLKQGGD